jgi:hypothetical protein
MPTPGHRSRRRLLSGPIAIAAVAVLVGAACGEDDEPVKLNGGQGTVTMVVARQPAADQGPVTVTLRSTR